MLLALMLSGLFWFGVLGSVHCRWRCLFWFGVLISCVLLALVLVCSGSVYWLVCVVGQYVVVWCVVGVDVVWFGVLISVLLALVLVCSGSVYWLVCCRSVCCCLVCSLMCNILCVVLCLFGLSVIYVLLLQYMLD